MDHSLNQAGFYLYLLAFLTTLARVFQPRLTCWVPLGFTATGALLQFAAFLIRWTHLSWAPVTTMYEILCYISFGLALAVFFTYRKFDAPVLAALSLILPIAALGVALFQESSELKPVVPGLQSRWMPIHVSCWCFSYSAFGVGFVVSSALIALRRLGRAPGLQEKLSDLFHRLVLFGFPFHTLGLITGALWAANAWASPWFHDPKEWTSAITWLIYAIYLHLHRKKIAGADWLGIVGMASILLTFIGVNFIPSARQSAHTYVNPGSPGWLMLGWILGPFVVLSVGLWALGFWRRTPVQDSKFKIQKRALDLES